MTISNKNNEDMINKKDLKKMALNSGSLGMEFSWNYERQMNIAFCKMLIPILEKIYKNNPKKYKEALKRHLEFFNITPQLAPFVGGIVVSMEEKNAKGEEIEPSAITGIKTALMGPLSGIGDSIFLGCIRVIALGVGLPLAMSGNILGPILYLLIYNIPAFLVRIIGAQKGYELGIDYLDKFQESGMMDKVMFAAGILGVMVIGCMTKDMVYTELALKFGTAETATTLQEVLDSIMPGIFGLGVTWLYYKLLGKGVNVIALLLGTIIVGIVGVALGVFAG